MSCRRWLPGIVALACLPTPYAQAQLLSDPSSLRHTYDVQAQRAEGLASSREDAALRLLAVAEEILALPRGPGPERTRLLGEAQGLADLLDSLDEDLVVATRMVQETRERLIQALESRIGSLLQAAEKAAMPERRSLESEARSLEKETELLRAAGEDVEEGSPLDSAAPTLSGLARVVAEEHARLTILRTLQEELRLFQGSLRLFDETSMPPSARSGGGEDLDPGCMPTACAVIGSSPADVPFTHFQPEDPGGGQGVTATTPMSLAHLHEQITAHIMVRERSPRDLSRDDVVVMREAVLGAGFMAFRGDERNSSALGPRAGASLVFSWPVGGDAELTVEPSVGGRTFRGESRVFTELAGEFRETLAGSAPGGRFRWQVTSWQKGRFLSEPMPPPGYLEPGRVEAGLVARLALPLDSRWGLEGESSVDGVRYEPEDWRVLDRQGLGAALGIAWRGASRSVRLTVRGSHHEFPSPLVGWEERRADTRVGAEVDASVERRLVARLSVGGSWNQSRLPAYDFWSGRAALVMSAPWGKGSLQGYAAVAHQVYLNPGPEGARVAPSDQDSGSIVSLQYVHPLDATHALMVRAAWSRSQTGFRNEFYERLGLGIHLTFRGY